MNKVIFKSRYGNNRYMEFLDPNTVIVYGKSHYCRIGSDFLYIDFEGGPFIAKDTKLNSIIDTNYKKKIISIESYKKDDYMAFKLELEDYE